MKQKVLKLWVISLMLVTLSCLVSEEALGWDWKVNISDAINTFSGIDQDPAVAYDGAGNIHVVWIDGYSALNVYYSKSSNNGATWSTPIQIGLGYHPQICIDGNNNIHVVWTNNYTYNISYCRSTNGGASFESPVNLGGMGGACQWADIATDLSTSPYVHIVWADWQNGGKLHYRRSTNAGGSWENAVILDSSGTAVGVKPCIETEGTSLVHILYSLNSGLQYIRSNNRGTTWSSSPTQLYYQVDTDFGYCLTASPTGGLHVAFATDHMQAISSTNSGNTWGPVKDIAGYGKRPSICVTGGGLVRVAYETQNASPNGILVVTSTDGGVNWDQAVRISDVNAGPFYPDIATRVAGAISHFCVVWGSDNSDGGDKDVYFMRDEWTPAPHISLDPTTLNFQAVQGDPNPSSQTFNITNTGGGTLNWSISENTDWLDAYPISGNSNFQTITVSVNTTDLTPGTHSVPIIVFSTNADNSPQVVSVIYVVSPKVFTLGRDNWQFPNNYYMWPYIWTPLDPLDEMCLFCIGPTRCFPTWDLFRDAFGQTQTEFYYPPVWKRRAKAVEYWNKHKGCWQGSCFGFAISALLYFNDYLALSNTFPGYSQVHDVPLNDDSRTLVNKYSLYQYGKEHMTYFNAHCGKTPVQTLNDLQQMLVNDKTNNRILLISSQDPNHPGGHAVVARSYVQDITNPAIYHVHIYDNNEPDTDDSIDINTSNGTWSYSQLPNWGGSKGLFLSDAASTYTTNPSIPLESTSKEKDFDLKQNPSDFIEIFTPSSTDLILRNSGGEPIGYLQSDSLLIDSMTNASPIIPFTGSEHPPIGYFVPGGDYTAQVSNSADSSFYFSVFTDSTFLGYLCTNFMANKSDKVSYLDADSKLQVKSEDMSPKELFFKMIKVEPNRDLVCNIQNFALTQHDSVQIKISDSSRFDFVNFGIGTTYTLSLELQADSTNPIFVHHNIPISGFSSQQIAPNWIYLDTLAVRILIDTDLNGTFEDTLIVTNQYGMRGDANQDGVIDVGDVVYLINYLFKSGPAPNPIEAGDANCDGVVDVGDVVYLINYLFKGGSAPGC